GNRARFEVFKRDRFTCQYCGRKPPAVILTIDHVLAQSRGGPDDPVNLVTACEDCNSGKSDVPLCSVPPTTQEQMQRRQEVREQVEAFDAFLAEEREREDDAIETVALRWYGIMSEGEPEWTFGDERRTSCRTFVRRLPLQRILEAVEIAAARKYGSVHNDA